MYGIVYVTQNTLDNMKYIGQHKCADENDDYLGSGSALKKAIKFYGKENFKRTTLYRAESAEELDRMEKAFIDAFDAVKSERYYNYAPGGSFLPGKDNPMFGHVWTEEEKKRCAHPGESHWNYGKHWPEEIKEKMRHSHKGNASWAKGVERSPEHCKHISEAKKCKKPNYTAEQRKQMAERITERNHTEKFKKQVSDANKRFHEHGGRRGNTPVFCIETEIVYASIGDAGRAIGRHVSVVSAVLHGRQETAGGYHWRIATPEEIAKGVVYV